MVGALHFVSQAAGAVSALLCDEAVPGPRPTRFPGRTTCQIQAGVSLQELGRKPCLWRDARRLMPLMRRVCWLRRLLRTTAADESGITRVYAEAPAGPVP